MPQAELRTEWCQTPFYCILVSRPLGGRMRREEGERAPQRVLAGVMLPALVCITPPPALPTHSSRMWRTAHPVTSWARYKGAGSGANPRRWPLGPSRGWSPANSDMAVLSPCPTGFPCLSPAFLGVLPRNHTHQESPPRALPLGHLAKDAAVTSRTALS